jgi:hypothetical protein
MPWGPLAELSGRNVTGVCVQIQRTWGRVAPHVRVQHEEMPTFARGASDLVCQRVSQTRLASVMYISHPFQHRVDCVALLSHACFYSGCSIPSRGVWLLFNL